MVKKILAAATALLLSFNAHAIAFNFSFSEDGIDDGFGTPVPGTVTGVISGLQDNLANQLAGVTVTITSYPAALGGTIENGLIATNWSGVSGDGFDVFGGVITDADLWAQEDGSGGPGVFDQLRLNALGYNRLTFDQSMTDTGNFGGFAGASYSRVSAPATLALVGLGLAGMGYQRRCKVA